MKGGRCHTIDEVYERSNPGWEYVAFGIQSRALLITRRCLMLTRRWGQAWRRPGPWPARRPARLARVAPLVRACALPSRSGSLQPRSPSGATPAPSACIFCVDRTWGRIECLAFLRRYLVEEKAACARPTRPACPAMLGIGAGLACAVWLPSGCRLGGAGWGWLACTGRPSFNATTNRRRWCMHRACTSNARRRWRGLGERTMRARRVAGRFRGARWQLFERPACG